MSDDDVRRLDGGFDQGASLHGDVVRRTSGPWTPWVHRLLQHLSDRGFTGAPRPIRITDDGYDEVSYLPGRTTGSERPWPVWVHGDDALVEVARWLRGYHAAASQFPPPLEAQWREIHDSTGPDVIIAHNDAAPYNAVWDGDHLVGFVDWDMAGPRRRDDDLAWTAFSWVPLHARHVVIGEGFTELERRRERLQLFLSSYGSALTCDDVLERLDVLIGAQLDLMRSRAETDPTYRRMIAVGRADDLATARAELGTI